MKLKIDIKIKNIEELKVLVKEAQSILDKIQNFKFDIEFNQCERS